MTNDQLSANAIAAGLQTRVLGRRIVYFERVGSTNDVAKQLADAGEPEGTLVIADEQTAGRGRLGRAWIAPPHSSILMSLVLRPALAPHQVGWVTMAVALGACQAIRAETGLAVQIKWPNDLIVRGKKLAGILSEAGIVNDELEYVVVGIGVNVNFNVTAIERIPADATTIADELRQPFPRVRLVQTLLQSIEEYYLRVNENLVPEYSARLSTLNQWVCVQTPAGVEAGMAERVNENGALILRRADGSRIELIAGEVTLIKP